MRFRKIPDETIKRLPIYLRRAIRLSEKGVKCVSSKELASLIGVTPWQIRKGVDSILRNNFVVFGKIGLLFAGMQVV